VRQVTKPDSASPGIAAKPVTRWSRLRAIVVGVFVAFVLSVGYGFWTSVQRQIKLTTYEPGTSVATILQDNGPPTVDRVPRDSERFSSARTERILSYDTTPWFMWAFTGVDLEFDRDDRLLRTWTVTE
jgi:hypothetical protein